MATDLTQRAGVFILEVAGDAVEQFNWEVNEGCRHCRIFESAGSNLTTIEKETQDWEYERLGYSYSSRRHMTARCESFNCF